MILIDDLGFAGTSAFGGPIPTPTFDRLASPGVHYNNFHTTAVSSPTRAVPILVTSCLSSPSAEA